MEYYVSQSTGDDKHDGLVEMTDGFHGPWKSLSRASKVDLHPGDRIFLKCGDEWTETLVPRGNGTKEDPIVIGTYGKGARPYIRRGISVAEERCILLDRVMGYSIIGLELGEARYGIEIRMDHSLSESWGPYRVEDCYFHDIINPDFPHTQSQGVDLSGWPWAIFKKLDEASDGCVLENLSVHHCFSTRCQGFHSTQYSEGGSGFGNISEIGTMYDSNTFHYSHDNNIYFCNGTNSTMINSGMFFGYPNRNEWPYGNAFIISGSPNLSKPTCGTKILDNEFGWVGDIPGGVDGCIYDLEFSQTDTCVRNNYMHNAFGEAVLIMGYAEIMNFAFDSNLIKDVLLYCTNRDMAIDIYNPNGTGTYTENLFFLKPGQRAFNQKPSGYVFHNNLEEAEGTFVKMPMVSAIAVQSESRSYTFLCETADADLRFTTDGSIPVSNSPCYLEPVTIFGSCIINMKAFKEGAFPSETNSILVDFREEERAHIHPCSTDETATEHNIITEEDFTISFFAGPDTSNLNADISWETSYFNTGINRNELTPCTGPISDDAMIDCIAIGVVITEKSIRLFECYDGQMKEVLSETCDISEQVHFGIVYRNRQPCLFINGVFRKTGFMSTKKVNPLLLPMSNETGLPGPSVGPFIIHDYPLTHAQIQVLYIHGSLN